MSLLLLQDGHGGPAKQLHGLNKASGNIQTAKAPPGRAQVKRSMLPSSLVLLPTSQQPAANQSSKDAEKEIARHKVTQHAPSTACKALPHQKVTPLTQPSHRQTSPSTTTDSTDGWSSPSSDAASSYQPSQEIVADEESPKPHHLAVKPSSISRGALGKSCRDTNFRPTKRHASAPCAGKADAHKAETPDFSKIAHTSGPKSCTLKQRSCADSAAACRYSLRVRHQKKTTQEQPSASASPKVFSR